MTAITEQRDTRERHVTYTNLWDHLAASSHTFIKGGMVAINATGLLVMASSTAGEIPCGRCEENVVTGAGNTRKVKFKSGVFKWANEGTAPVVQATVGRDCFVQDNATVRVSDDTSSVAGKVVELDTDGVWVSQPFPLVIT
jgi:hypothetical protein